MTFRAILFDKDGTLFDFEASWAGWMRDLIVELSEGSSDRIAALADVLRFDIETCRFSPGSPVIAGTLEEITDLIAPILLDRPSEVDVLLARVDASAAAVTMAPVVPLRPFLDGLRAKGFALGLATNASGAEATAHLRQHGVVDRFDFIAGYDSGHGAKPDPGMCRAFADALGLPPDQVLMVGDSLHDLVAGRAAGMRNVAVLTGIAGRDELAPFADAVLPDIGALPAWLADVRTAADARGPVRWRQE